MTRVSEEIGKVLLAGSDVHEGVLTRVRSAWTSDFILVDGPSCREIVSYGRDGIVSRERVILHTPGWNYKWRDNEWVMHEGGVEFVEIRDAYSCDADRLFICRELTPELLFDMAVLVQCGIGFIPADFVGGFEAWSVDVGKVFGDVDVSEYFAWDVVKDVLVETFGDGELTAVHFYILVG